MAARRTLSLEDAARLAKERGILDRDYYALDRSQTDVLRELFDRTRWRQSASSAAMGRSKLYAFHLALDRAAPRRDARRSSRDPVMEIIHTNRRYPGGVEYTVKVPDAKIRRGYDLVRVVVHDSGLISTRSANNSRTTPSRASDFVKRHIDRDRDRGGSSRQRDPAEPFSVSMTYEIITPESAEHGDVEDQGYDYQDKRMSLSDVVREVESHGPYDEIQEMSDSRGALLRLYESEGSINYRTGAETRHALHIRGSERAIRRLAQVLASRDVGRDRSRTRRRR